MHVSIKHMDSGLKGLSSTSQAEACLVETDKPFMVTTQFPSHVTSLPDIVPTEGKYSCTFLFWRDQQVFLTFLQGGKPVTCSLKLKNHTPVLERQVDGVAFDIRREPFSWSFQV